MRITDRNNGPSETATVQDVPYRVTVPCAATSDRWSRAGGRSGTSAQVRVNDGGADGVASTTPNTLFAVQGVFVP